MRVYVFISYTSIYKKKIFYFGHKIKSNKNNILGRRIFYFEINIFINNGISMQVIPEFELLHVLAQSKFNAFKFHLSLVAFSNIFYRVFTSLGKIGDTFFISQTF